MTSMTIDQHNRDDQSVALLVLVEPTGLTRCSNGPNARAAPTNFSSSLVRLFLSVPLVP